MTTTQLFAIYMDFSIPTMEVCRRLGVTRSKLFGLRKRYGLPPRPKNKSNERHVDPTPEEIAERAAECRARRSPTEKARMERAGLTRWELPSYAYDGRSCSFSGVSS